MGNSQSPIVVEAPVTAGDGTNRMDSPERLNCSPRTLDETVQYLAAQQAELLAQQKELTAQLKSVNSAGALRPRKDFFDMVAAFAPILSGTIIALGGAYFTVLYNQQQLKLQEIQTIERFLPHLVGDERSKKAAILAISSLTDAKLAGKIAAIYASKGTVSALEQIAEQGNQGDRKVASSALAKALDTMAENYSLDKHYEEAIGTYKKALAVRAESYGEYSPLLAPGLGKLADLYQARRDFAQSETVLKRLVEVQKRSYGEDSAPAINALKRLQALYSAEGSSQRSADLARLIADGEAKLKAQGKDAQELPAVLDEESLAPAGEPELQPDSAVAEQQPPPQPSTSVPSNHAAAGVRNDTAHGASAAPAHNAANAERVDAEPTESKTFTPVQ